ncbi:MAG: DUF721 domain-containing protein [Cyanobacteria bacterium SZAS LIN-3]|nr:DUF721 domain-containing protein [Cyanobacteria bacterium SZAS LIN-3]
MDEDEKKPESRGISGPGALPNSRPELRGGSKSGAGAGSESKFGAKSDGKSYDAPYTQQHLLGARSKGRRNFSDISRVLPQVLRKLGLDNRLKEQTFINLWPHIVGHPFGALSRPLFIDNERNIVVAVRDASTGQEMTFAKVQLLKAIRQAARGVGIEITGMRFDLKRFNENPVNPIPEILPDPSRGLPEPTAADLAAVVVTPEQYEEIEALGQSFLAAHPEAEPSLVSRVQALFEKEIRLRTWREGKGYPHCSKCGDVTPRLHGTELICAQCFAAGMS